MSIPGLIIIGESINDSVPSTHRLFEENNIDGIIDLAKLHADKGTTYKDVNKSFFESGKVKRKGKFVIGIVSGDVHDIGKNLISMIIKGSGFEVIDLGVDVPTIKFLDAIAQHPGCFIGLSALLTTTMRNMEVSLKTIREKYPNTKV
jgi:methanogenic corrinoid protein MtbC1